MGLATQETGRSVTDPMTDQAPRRPIRHIVVALVLAGFVISFAVGIQTLSSASGLVNRLLGENMLWPATQTVTDMARLEGALTRLAVAPDPAASAQVNERLDIVWSRLSILEGGELSRLLAQMGLTEPVRALRTVLVQVDDLLPRLSTGTDDSAVAAEAALALVGPQISRLQGWSVDVLHADRDEMLGYVDDRFQAIWTVIVSFGGLVTSGLIFVLLLSLEIRAGRRQTLAAERARNEAAAAEQRLIDAIEAIPEGFALYDADDRLVLYNTHYQTLYRDSAPAIVSGATFEDIIRYGVERGQYADAIGREEGWIAERVRQHQVPTGTIEQRLSDGRWVKIEERRTSEGGVVGVRVDVTGIRRAQDLLSRAEQAADLGHFSLDAETGEVLLSRHLHTVLDIDRQTTATERLLLDRIDPEDRPRLHDALNQARHDTTPHHGIYRSVPVEDRPRWFAVNLVPETDPHGKPLGILGTVQDVTSRKEVEDSLAAATAEAKAANDAKSRFLSIMSHEIRTPMNGVAGALNLIETERLEPEDAEMIDLARRSADRLRIVLNDVLDYTRIESGRLDLEDSVFDPRGFVQEAVAFWRAAASEKGLAIAWSVDVMVPERLTGDAGRLRQIVDNLISNAIKFTDQGRVDVAMSVTMPAGASAATERQADQVVRIAVRDTGPGIADDDRHRVFAEFSQLQGPASNIQGGSGLGLAICRRLCALMGGRIDFTSNFGRGTIFVVEIPLRVADAGTAVPSSRRASTQDADQNLPQNLRVLVAEDNPTNQIVIGQTLRRLGCTVDLVGNGQEAVSAVAARPYDLVVMDVSMPVLDGIEATRLIRSRHDPTLPIIGYTAHAMLEERRRFLAAGMSEVVPKPVSPKDLSAAIRSVLRDRPTADHRPPSEPAGSDAPPEDDGPVFDPEVTEMLAQSLTPSTFAEVARQFAIDVSSNIAAVEQAFETNDHAALDRAAHTLAGVAATLGARSLETQARAVHRLCQQAQIDQIDAAAIGRLRAAADRALASAPAIAADRPPDDAQDAPQPSPTAPVAVDDTVRRQARP